MVKKKIVKKILLRWKKPTVMGGRGKHLEKYRKATSIQWEKRRQTGEKVDSYEAGQAWSRTVPPTKKKLTPKEHRKKRKSEPTIPVELTPKEKQALKEWESKINPKRKPLKFGKGGAIKKVGKEIMSYVGKKLHKKKPVVKKTKKPYSLADWKQGIKYGKGGAASSTFAKAIQIAEQHGIIKKTGSATGTAAAAAGLSGLTEEELRRLRGYSKGGAIKKGITIIVDPRGKAKIKASVKQVKERAEKELEDFIKNLNPKGFQSGGLVKPKSVRIAKRGWGKVIK